MRVLLAEIDVDRFRKRAQSTGAYGARRVSIVPGRARAIDRSMAPVDGAGVSLEPGAVEDLRGLGGEEFLVEVIDTFLDDAPALISTLKASDERGDAEELRRTAHSLKSNGQTFGAKLFAELCRELEQRAKQGKLDGASELVNRIDREYVALENALVALRPEAAP